MTDFDKTLEKVKEILGVKKDSEVANAIGLKPSAFANRKKSNSVPFSHYMNVMKSYNVNLNWLVYGEGPKYNDAHSQAGDTQPLSQELKSSSENNDITVIEHCNLVKEFIDQNIAKEFNYYLVGIEADDPEGYKSLFQEAKTTYKTINRMKAKFHPSSNSEDEHQKKIS